MKKKQKGKFVKSVFIIMGGTTFAQVLNIILSPIITRLYSPEEYGILVSYTAIVGLLSFGTFKYELALPIERDEKKAINVLVLCFILLIIFVIIITLLLKYFGVVLLGLFDSEILMKYRYLLPAGIFVTGLYAILNKWAYRNKEYTNISKTIVNQSLFSNTTKVIAGLSSFGPLGLILGQIIGMGAGIRVLSKTLFLNKFKYIKMVNLKEIAYSISRYKDFPIFNMPSYFLLTLGSTLPIIFYTAYFGSAIAGYYGLAYTIVKLPINIIGNTVADVFYSEAASIGKENPKKLNKLSKELFKKLILIGLIPLAILLLFGPKLFILVFGENWLIAGKYSQLISFMIFSMLIFAPSGRIYLIFEKQRIRLYLDIIRIIFVILTFLLSSIFSLDAYLSIALYSFVMSINFFIMHIVAKTILKNEINCSKTTRV